jgi:hypothetical protein
MVLAAIPIVRARRKSENLLQVLLREWALGVMMDGSFGFVRVVGGVVFRFGRVWFGFVLILIFVGDGAVAWLVSSHVEVVKG